MNENNVELIKNLRKQGLNSKQIADRLKISLQIVNEAFEIIAKQKISPAQLGHFEKLVERKKEQNLELQGTQEALVLNIKALWSMVEMLEQKKKFLENTIEDMEK
jgi:hypothetical protein